MRCGCDADAVANDMDDCLWHLIHPANWPQSRVGNAEEDTKQTEPNADELIYIEITLSFTFHESIFASLLRFQTHSIDVQAMALAGSKNQL